MELNQWIEKRLKDLGIDPETWNVLCPDLLVSNNQQLTSLNSRSI